MKFNHKFHMVNYSPWPIMSAMGTLILMMGSVKMLKKKNMNMWIISMMIMLNIMWQWWRDIIRESTFQGSHTYWIMMSMKIGMILFIISEIMFFISFFWSYFHLSLSQMIELGMMWPPIGIKVFNPFMIPLLNTIILLTSGMSITWSHHSLLKKNNKQFLYSLMLTILLGIYFFMLQKFEYNEAMFNISDSAYGTTFFMITGFHGIHVMLGITFLSIMLFRSYNFHFSNFHHFGFEAAAWYWHFVDIVWLFLYISMYWWGK